MIDLRKLRHERDRREFNSLLIALVIAVLGDSPCSMACLHAPATATTPSATPPKPATWTPGHAMRSSDRQRTWLGLELLDMARAVADYDLPGRIIAWL
jgi:hypothetical protein